MRKDDWRFGPLWTLFLLSSLVVAGGLTGCAPRFGDTLRLDHGPVQSDLRITKVVLYQSGVGYFERRGRVKGNVLSLRIRHDQVMDVLKSLTVVDRRNGQAVSVSLPAERSRLMQISQLPPQVRTSGGLLAIASAFRGATAVVSGEWRSHRGRIVGVENIGTEKQPDWRLTLLRGGVVTSHPIAKIKSLKVLDRTLTVGLSKSLDVALNKGRWKPVRLTVRLTGKGPHDLVVSYVVPMPTWKPAYRLVVGEQKGKGPGKVLLQGWSVVDNLSGEDWRGARLSLTAGTPLAFKYDLYTPRDVERPDLTPSRTQTAEAPPPAVDSTSPGASKEEAAPKVSSRSRWGRPSPVMRPPRRSRYSRRGAGSSSRGRRYGAKKSKRYSPRGGAVSGNAPASEPDRDESGVSAKALQRSYRTLVSGTAVGSLFRYDIQTPITVPDRSSALVSIINKPVPGEDVLYFIVGGGRPNPYRAVRIKNTTGYVLERGPVTIYRKGAFVGEALGGRVEKQAVAFVPYALEGRVIIHLSSSVKDEGMKLVKIRNGYLTVASQSVTRYTYKVTDRSGEPLALYVSRPRRSGWKIVEPKNVILEKTLYYAKIPLKTSGVTTFTVKEVTPVKRTFYMFDSRARKAIALYLAGSSLSPELAKKLKDVLALWDEISALDNTLRTLNSSIHMLRRRLADIRANIKVLGRRANRDLRRKLLVSMTNIEKQLNTMNRKWVVANMKRGELRQRLSVTLKMVRL